MALYTILRVYQVPADNRLEATDRMLEALTLGVEDDFHVKDVLREPDGKPGSEFGSPSSRPKAGEACCWTNCSDGPRQPSVERLFLLPTQTRGKVQKFNFLMNPAVCAPWLLRWSSR